MGPNEYLLGKGVTWTGVYFVCLHFGVKRILDTGEPGVWWGSADSPIRISVDPLN